MSRKLNSLSLAKEKRRFGRLTVLGSAPMRHRRKHVLCLCACGAFCSQSLLNLMTGNSKSCGCYQQEVRREKATIHGQNRKGLRTKEYTAWASMISRCTNERDKEFKNYGGRGIGVYTAWRTSFPAFFSDMGSCPPGLTLERINNDGNYAPDNCRWASWSEQQRNSRRTRKITCRGVTKPLVDWAKQLGLHHTALLARLKRGWSIERTVSEPPKRRQQLAGKLG